MNAERRRAKRRLSPREPEVRWLEGNEKELLLLLRSIEMEYGLIIVVEGKRDEIALRRLGISKPILRTQSGKKREELIDRIVQTRSDDEEVLILTDFDVEGAELAEYIERQLELKHIPVQKRLRGRIRKLMANLRHVEQLIVLLRRRDSPLPLDHPDQ